MRLIDEAELYFLLGDRTYTQLVSAIQVFFNGLPFKGSGIFEHNYLNVSSSPPTANNYKTFELLSPPPPIDMIEFGNQTAAFDYHGQNNPLHHRASSIDWKGNINEPNHGNSYPFTNEKILVTGAHEEILRLKTNQIIRLIENVVQSKVLKISLLYYFNTSLVPFIVSCERVVVEPKGHLANPLDDVLPSPPKVEDIEMLKKIEHDERNAMLRKLQMDVTTGHKTKYNRMESDIEVVGVKSSSDKFSKSSPLKKQLQRTASDIYGTTHDFEIRKEISKEVRQNSQPTILQPPQQINPNDHTPEEDLENIYRQRIPNTTELRSKFSGTRRTMLGNFISLGPKGSPLKEQLKSPTNDSPNNNNNNLTSTILSHYKIGIGADKAPKDSIKSKHYTQITDSYSYRIKSYSDRIRGQPESTSKKSLSS